MPPTTTSPVPRWTDAAPEHAYGRTARADSWTRYACGALVGTGLLLVTYQWLAGRGLQDLSGWATGLTSLGRWTGLVASFLLLVQVLLMARIPVVERAW